MPPSNPGQTVRKKATEACERCREKRIRVCGSSLVLVTQRGQCNGTQPCDQCKKKESICVFALPPVTAKGHEALAEKLDAILARLDRIEHGLVQTILFNGPHEPGAAPTVSLSKTCAGDSRPATTNQLFSAEMSPTGFAQLNKQTGCFEYYGGTSTFVIASVLAKRVGQLEEVVDSSAKKRCLDHGDDFLISRSDTPRSLGLEELPGFCDYVAPPDALRHDRSIRSCVADRHLDSFFQTIHIFIPLFYEPKFRERYGSIRALFGDHRLFSPATEDRTRPQFVCLLYAVLALGALYEPEREDSSSWASWYFAEAQSMLGRLLEATNLQLVQAALLLVSANNLSAGETYM
ncbi:unnamed protein product [Clonostachys rosea]|uniref:Xylanolytic transcriptional activator regulatory domain-containing protein n=1 Tax=Bionectria ochroleuca TaxID=29856 RepID=A0ABY6TYK8_BIOOC|nr:unnamed protein product [Clonostachys rosea]